MEFKVITKENLACEHICCAISGNDDCQVSSKKSWLADRFDDGLIFLKGDVRGKCFIEYIPAENAWAPIVADGYMYIDCFWVSGQFKGHGFGDMLLKKCINDSREKGKKGLVVLSSGKKAPFLSDPDYLKHKGFSVCDSAAPFYELMYLPFSEDGAEKPRFAASVKAPEPIGQGFVLYYSHQCPFTAKYVPLIEAVAARIGVPFKSVLFESSKQAQNAPAPFTVYTLFYDGRFITGEILSEKKFEKIAAELSGR